MNSSEMRLRAAILVLTTGLHGCAVIPFVPLIAHAAPRMAFPGHDPSAPPPPAPVPSDPAIARGLAAVGPGEGDNGVTIPQQDRVAFVPDAPGSIPLRVAAVDLISDIKARGVGDIVTVLVSESVSGETKAQTDLANKRSTTGSLPNLFMATESLAAHNPLLNLGSLFNGGADNSTTGAGDMTADDTFTTIISAVVTGVNPSGTLTIKGERKLKVNGEDDTIHISGVVRPEDIDANNSVASANVADLDVSITGSGQVRDKQGNGLGTRLLDWLWLF